jgi:DNA-binding SARP family transcriptional activator
VELGVLGPLSIRTDVEVGVPTAPKLRNVLAMLLTHADQVVPVAVLMREIWDDEPPASWLTTLQTYILNLRKLFAAIMDLSGVEVANNILVTRTGGYSFQTAGATIDVHTYHSLVAAGRAALTDGDDAASVRFLTDALNLWRGPALVDVRVGRVLESKRLQFEESRLVVLEYLVDSELRLGMYREVLTELAALTVENPLQEGLHSQYMRALYLSGRRAQALEVFHRLRRTLIAELGLEPGPAVQQLHQSILTSDTDIDMHMRIERPLGEIVRTSTLGGARLY